MRRDKAIPQRPKSLSRNIPARSDDENRLDQTTIVSGARRQKCRRTDIGLLDHR